MTDTAALIATAAAKTAAHAGLASALEYGTIRVLRINGVDHVYATENGTTYTVTVNPATGVAACNGYTTCRDLAHAAIHAHRTR
jgi:hypothetical protein